ncbi:type II toxin-antitoxin system RelE/ParE family toxin [Antarcticirhabdus aurantiaca]|uniref:Type II toxin-antitoxin system RelE/ParE family toxin n=1 Tax=Antarcticirhabdus aurantiaca TaxID=2606717 RepID=A0ACD4NHI4_9HYPH|nr:type II toxin-antitoxin system RelE/ParE family toxin [Antarcticirhabdus aurantiaca]WAJ26247.1 type II toxin-antitoxin system RelE/ParE family toxin [Jeongeuplla avenae]
MTSFSLSGRVDRELLDIYLSGIELFGRRQALRYIEELERVFGLLAENPRMGRAAPTIGTNVRRHEHAAHIILYRVEPSGVRVLALVAAGNVEDLHA